jgi:hypothetical protein
MSGLGSSRNQGARLAFVPLLVALVMAALALPRAIPPRELPLPLVDAAAVARQIALDHRLAESARRRPLDATVRALGEAIRQFNAAEVRDDVASATRYRSEIGVALRGAEEASRDSQGASNFEPILELRAVQTEDFLTEVARFERTGVRSPELDQLAGTFLPAMIRVGWAREPGGGLATYPPKGPLKIILDDEERRAAFKQTWDKVAGVSERPELVLSLDESRALYSFYLRHPHAPESQRSALGLARGQARDAETCARIDDGERVATFGWVLAKLKELSLLDPSYPLAYARGIALFHRHEYAASAEAFRTWLDQHPDGPWTLRAQNYLLAAERAGTEL